MAQIPVSHRRMREFCIAHETITLAANQGWRPRIDIVAEAIKIVDEYQAAGKLWERYQSWVAHA